MHYFQGCLSRLDAQLTYQPLTQLESFCDTSHGLLPLNASPCLAQSVAGTEAFTPNTNMGDSSLRRVSRRESHHRKSAKRGAIKPKRRRLLSIQPSCGPDEENIVVDSQFNQDRMNCDTSTSTQSARSRRVLQAIWALRIKSWIFRLLIKHWSN